MTNPGGGNRSISGGLFLLLTFCLLLFTVLTPAFSEEEKTEEYKFDASEIEKNPYHLGGYLEFKPILLGLDKKASLYKLNFFNRNVGATTPEYDGTLQLEGSLEKGISRFYLKTNASYTNTTQKETTNFTLLEGNLSLKREIAIRLKDFGSLHGTYGKLDRALSGEQNKLGKPIFEVHTWEGLSPFFNIAQMIDLMTIFIKVMLIAIVLVSVMNVMIMAVYERIREIGTIAAIGTLPGKILSMFMVEGLLLGVFGVVIGNALGLAIIFVLRLAQISFTFARQTFVLSPSVQLSDLLIVSGIVVVVAILGSLQPALKASRMEPITALRHV